MASEASSGTAIVAEIASHELQFREGQFLQPRELVLYSLMKTTANPLMNPKNRNLDYSTDTKAVIAWNAAIVCRTLNRIYRSRHTEEDFLQYVWCMLNMGDEKNPNKVGLFDGLPRIDYFAPYVDLFLSHCSYQLVKILNGASVPHIREVAEEAMRVCRTLLDGDAASLMPAKPLVVKQLSFGSLHLHMVNFPNWKYDVSSNKLILWQPLATKPHVAQKVIEMEYDLSWTVTVNGKVCELPWMENTKLTSVKQFVELVKEVEECYVCNGLVLSDYEDIVNVCFSHDVLCDKGHVVARIHNDFIQSEACLRLLRPRANSRQCRECGIRLIEAFEKSLSAAQTQSKSSLELESLNTIAQLNYQLRSKKQQILDMWEQYIKLREENIRLKEENIVQQSQVIVVPEDWMSEQRHVRADTIELLHEQRRSSEPPQKMLKTEAKTAVKVHVPNNTVRVDLPPTAAMDSHHPAEETTSVAVNSPNVKIVRQTHD